MDIVILPDAAEAASPAAALVPRPGERTIAHPSGRPWLVGDWRDQDVTVVAAGARRLVLLGATRLDREHAQRRLARAAGVRDLDGLLRSLPGSPYAIAQIDGRIRAQGPISTARQFFYRSAAGVPVAANTPEPLARLSGASVDRAGLALRLLSPVTPWPFSQRTVWDGISAVPVGHWLELGAAGPARTLPWWAPPPAELPLSGSADDLRSALTEAIAVRIGGRNVISADLSGGLDSTSLCFLAAAAGADLVTYHVQPLDEENADTVWARRAAEALPRARHLSIPDGHESSWFDPPAGDDDPAAEGPLPWHGGRATLARTAAAVAAHGSSLHLTGIGGDELFGILPALLWSLARRHPISALPSLRRYQVLNSWRVRPFVAGLIDRADFAQHLADTARHVAHPSTRPGGPLLGWGVAPSLPPWATPDAVETVQRLMAETAQAAPAPLAADHYRHQVLAALVAEGSMVRQMSRSIAPSGVAWEAPYLDDRIIEIALSVRLRDRATPGRYKPLLAAAVRGVAPAAFADRTDKGEFSAEMYRGLRHNRQALVGLCDEMRLAELGLIDADVLRAAVLRPMPGSRDLAPFQNTLSTESWLRALSAAPTNTGGGIR